MTLQKMMGEIHLLFTVVVRHVLLLQWNNVNCRCLKTKENTWIQEKWSNWGMKDIIYKNM